MVDVWSDNPLGLDGSRVIDRRVYVDPAIFEAEQDRLFAGTWQWVAHESELPEFGDYVTATVASRPIVISRGEAGLITVFMNTCTHRGAVIAPQPRGNSGGSFVCFYHAWCFNTEGKLTSAPMSAAYGENLQKTRYNTPIVRHEVFAGNIFVVFNNDTPSLLDYLGAVSPYVELYTGRHEVLGRVRWMLEGNWKLWHENFRDNYHPMFTHAVLGANYQGVKADGRNEDLGLGHSVMIFPSQGNSGQIRSTVRKITGRTMTADVALRANANAERPAEHHITAVFPNLDFQYSGDGRLQNVMQIVRPISVDKSVVELIAFGEVGEPEAVRKSRLDRSLDSQTSAGKISGDDTEAARRCTAGFGTVREVRWSNMDRGQAAGAVGGKNDEYSLRGFYSRYKNYLADVLAEPFGDAQAEVEQSPNAT